MNTISTRQNVTQMDGPGDRHFITLNVASDLQAVADREDENVITPSEHHYVQNSQTPVAEDVELQLMYVEGSADQAGQLYLLNEETNAYEAIEHRGGRQSNATDYYLDWTDQNGNSANMELVEVDIRAPGIMEGYQRGDYGLYYIDGDKNRIGMGVYPTNPDARVVVFHPEGAGDKPEFMLEYIEWVKTVDEDSYEYINILDGDKPFYEQSEHPHTRRWLAVDEVQVNTQLVPSQGAPSGN